LLLVIIGSSGRGWVIRQADDYIVFGNISWCALPDIAADDRHNLKPAKGNSIFNLSLFYYELGITIELLFFLFAVTYKIKRRSSSASRRKKAEAGDGAQGAGKTSGRAGSQTGRAHRTLRHAR